MPKAITVHSARKGARRLTNARATGREVFSGRKKILLTLLDADTDLAHSLGGGLQRLNVALQAHCWQDGASSVRGMAAALADGVDLWMAAGPKRAFENPAIRRSLSLTALAAQSVHPLPLLLASRGGAPATLPEALAQAHLAAGDITGQILSLLHQPPTLPPPDWRLGIHCPPSMGLWLEIGPRAGRWDGALLGVSGGDGENVRPLAHAVSKAGDLFAQRELTDPVRGLRLQLPQGAFAAWGTHAVLTPETSYFVGVSALPDALLFGAFPGGEGELTVISLR